MQELPHRDSAGSETPLATATDAATHRPKSSWPELLGASSEVAKQKILSDRPDVRVFVVPVGNNVTGDFNDKRVHVFVNTHGDVARVASIG
uniref:Subtilisin-chymotrypsin inhibitor-2A n=1 Tax=Aegilops tauschii TaxID=37682 RepID=R7W1Z4_AEGTA